MTKKTAYQIIDAHDLAMNDSFISDLCEKNKFSTTKFHEIIQAIQVISDFTADNNMIDKRLIRKIFFIYSRLRVGLLDYLLLNHFSDFTQHNYLDLYQDVENMEQNIMKLLL